MIKWFKSINWYRLNRNLHRDIGYFCIGFSIIFAVSGIAVNHIADWNPNYAVERQTKQVDDSDWLTLDDQQIIQRMQSSFDLTQAVKSSFWQNKNQFEVFLDDGDTLFWDRRQHQVSYQDIEPRVILQALNKLHLNETRNAWVYFSDLFAGMLIFLALSALFMVKGKHGPAKPKSIVLMSLGVFIPAFFLFLS
ncbi:PepSY-associated TM helix domain-containing protein [Shewanella electrodiphila]|uniref:PepSY-associated TM helix domain-containing protein n=1 Tax=Shewanella electrodiphila TaxID=934143 RepID=A0ABT0KPC8_9GAMM|nr:PepSY-associated TM helix domain-containing protein [Shewanella electrodiphila]MCL1045700.1 PepSY-associated TM helix domain-containing protein [Shewanella electrodiphila]